MKAAKIIAAALILIFLSAPAGAAQDARWPRVWTANGNTLIVYQPQIDEWKQYKEVDWRMAFSLTPKGGKQAIGVAELHGRTTVDNDAKMVLIDNIKLKEIHFPSLDKASAAKLEQLFKKFLPEAVTMTSQQFAACVPKSGTVQGVKLNNDPPRIFVSYKPAILLGVNGPPVRGKMKDGKLEFVKVGDRLLLADSITPDELRLTYRGTQISKEPLRQYYRKRDPGFLAVMKALKEEGGASSSIQRSSCCTATGAACFARPRTRCCSAWAIPSSTRRCYCCHGRGIRAPRSRSGSPGGPCATARCLPERRRSWR